MSASRIVVSAVASMVTLVPAAGPGAAAAPVGDPPTRTVVSKVVKRHGKLIFKGRVEPDHVSRPVYLQRKTCKSCEWKFYRKVTSDASSHYKGEIDVPRKGAWFWRAKVNAYGGYATSYSGVWKTYLASS